MKKKMITIMLTTDADPHTLNRVAHDMMYQYETLEEVGYKVSDVDVNVTDLEGSNESAQDNRKG